MVMQTASPPEATNCQLLSVESIQLPSIPALGLPPPATTTSRTQFTDHSQAQRLQISQPANPLADHGRNATVGQSNTDSQQQRQFTSTAMLHATSSGAGVDHGRTTRLFGNFRNIAGVNGNINVTGEPGQLSLAEQYPIATSLFAGAFAGAIAKTVIAPLDRTKINFQIRNVPYSLRKAFRFLAESYRKDGLSSWWRGNTATMARVIPYAALNYTAHEQWKKTLRVETREERKNHPLLGFVAGSLAGVTAASLTYPLDLARARMAVSRCETYRNLVEVFLKIWRNEGPQALYRGFVPSLLGVIPYAGASFFTYEWLKNHRLDFKNIETVLEKITHESAGSTSADKTEKVVPQGELHPMERLACGAIAGLIGQSSSYPLDIVRRRMQTSRLTGKNYRTIRGTILHIMKHEGLRRGLFKGLSMNWIKGPISVGTSFMVYDIIKNFLDSHHL